jgi:hypothetical protein
MIIKGVSDIRGMRGLTTRPGTTTESSAFLELYQLATERDHLMKKLQWIRWQKDQAEKRLSEIAHTAYRVEKKAKRAPTLIASSGFRSPFIEY